MGYVLIIGEGLDATSLDLALCEAGFSCQLVSDAVKALVHARRKTPDVILLDTEASGFDAVKHLGYRFSETRVPLLLLMPPEQADVINIGQAAGFDGCLRKPANVDVVITLVREHLKTREEDRHAE